jgi:hypothetical protein
MSLFIATNRIFGQGDYRSLSESLNIENDRMSESVNMFYSLLADFTPINELQGDLFKYGFKNMKIMITYLFT